MENLRLSGFSDIFFSLIQVDLPIDEKYKESIPYFIKSAIAQSQITNACIYIYDNIFTLIDNHAVGLTNAERYGKDISDKENRRSLRFAFIGAVIGVIVTIIIEVIRSKFDLF